MATITKLPPPPPVEDKLATCNYCKCEFSYGEHDITSDRHLLDGGWGGIGIEYKVKCPNCGYSQRVGNDYIPPK